MSCVVSWKIVRLHGSVFVAVGLAGSLVAAYIGPVQEICAGMLAGLIVGLAGLISAVWITHRFAPGARQAPGRWDLWSAWGAGLVTRLLLIGAACWVLRKIFGESFQSALYSLAAVYLALHFWETVWLYEKLDPPAKSGVLHG